MGTLARRSVALTLLAAFLGVASTSSAQDSDTDKARVLRWQSLRTTIFGQRTLIDGSGRIGLEAPSRALDAALVPITIKLNGSEPAKGLYLIVDMNPAPLAGHFVFGPQSDPSLLKLRIRVDQYTSIHAIAETTTGVLYVTERFIKASGGCSAPAGASEAEALQDLGQMKLKLLTPVAAGIPARAQLMIRHPNFNGMQMNQLTHLYTPARYLRAIDVTYRGGKVFHLDSDISLSADPVITFGFVPASGGELHVAARDSKGTSFEHQFSIPPR